MKRPRGRPTDLEEGELKGRIVQAAVDEFARSGYDGARIGKMAKAAGCDRALLYFYFRDKAGLFEAALNDGALRRARQMGTQPGTLAESLIYWFRQNLSEPRLIRLVMQEALAEGEDASPPPRRLSYLEGQLQAVKDFQARGLLRADIDPRHMLTIILALTSFPACFPRIAGIALAASESQSLDEAWSAAL